MKILATRDDGARLIGDDNLDCGLLSSGEGSVILPIASIMSRGYWEVRPADGHSIQLQPEVEAAIRQRSAEFSENLASKQTMTGTAPS
jgi:hypothetical protein